MEKTLTTLERIEQSNPYTDLNYGRQTAWLEGAKFERNKVIEEVKETILGFETGLLPEDHIGKVLYEILNAMKI